MLLPQYKQAVSGADVRPAAVLLEACQAPSLAAWYGEPLAPPLAEALCRRAQRELQHRLCRGGACFPLHVAQLICQFWMDAATTQAAARLLALAQDARDLALLHLCYGQLLISCKLRPATHHLSQGFALAVPDLQSTEYFSLVRQHELLACLPLADTPSPPLPLHILLTEAAVIGRLQQDDRSRQYSTHVDTVG